MKCPKCDGTLVADASTAIPQSRCDRCGALWLKRVAFDAFVRLEASTRGAELTTLALLEGPAQPTSLTCPDCAMATLDVVTLRGVPVESCRSCGSLLLDAGEPDTIADRVAGGVKAWTPAYEEMMRLVTARGPRIFQGVTLE